MPFSACPMCNAPVTLGSGIITACGGFGFAALGDRLGGAGDRADAEGLRRIGVGDAGVVPDGSPLCGRGGGVVLLRKIHALF